MELKVFHRFVCAVLALLAAILLFSAVMSRAGGDFGFITWITLRFATPVWIIDLAILIPWRKVSAWMIPVLPIAGAIVGAASLFAWACLDAQLHNSWSRLWVPDEGPGLGGFLIFAAIVGFVTNACYLAFLSIFIKLREHRKTQ
jgi:hypothetical protein